MPCLCIAQLQYEQCQLGHALNDESLSTGSDDEAGIKEGQGEQTVVCLCGSFFGTVNVSRGIGQSNQIITLHQCGRRYGGGNTESVAHVKRQHFG